MSLLEDAGVKGRARIALIFAILVLSFAAITSSAAFFTTRDAARVPDTTVPCVANWQRDYVQALNERVPVNEAKNSAINKLLKELLKIFNGTASTNDPSGAVIKALEDAIRESDKQSAVLFRVSYPDYFCTLDGKIVINQPPGAGEEPSP